MTKFQQIEKRLWELGCLKIGRHDGSTHGSRKTGYRVHGFVNGKTSDFATLKGVVDMLDRWRDDGEKTD